MGHPLRSLHFENLLSPPLISPYILKNLGGIRPPSVGRSYKKSYIMYIGLYVCNGNRLSWFSQNLALLLALKYFAERKGAVKIVKTVHPLSIWSCVQAQKCPKMNTDEHTMNTIFLKNCVYDLFILCITIEDIKTKWEKAMLDILDQ